MSIQILKMLREQAWTPTPHGEQFSLHFDDTRYLELIAEHFAHTAEGFSCTTAAAGTPDKYAAGYEAGYNTAVTHIAAHIRARYLG